MPRRREVPKREILPDPKFGNVELSKFMNVIMENWHYPTHPDSLGKKLLALENRHTSRSRTTKTASPVIRNPHTESQEA